MTAQIHILDAVRGTPAKINAAHNVLEARDNWGRTPLLAAILDGTVTEVRALLRAGANPNEVLSGETANCFASGETALMLAAPEPQKLKLLLQYGADPMAGPQGGLAAWLSQELAEDNGDVPEYFEGLEVSAAMLKRSAV
ncbi:ankyrin repeat domain-containing protein [Rhodobacteraceae bacterium D3-12]|nr:ankyrin repeat domain-containing protein [Rhodobacteraceae bacterium D3-12]